MKKILASKKIVFLMLLIITFTLCFVVLSNTVSAETVEYLNVIDHGIYGSAYYDIISNGKAVGTIRVTTTIETIVNSINNFPSTFLFIEVIYTPISDKYYLDGFDIEIAFSPNYNSYVRKNVCNNVTAVVTTTSTVGLTFNSNGEYTFSTSFAQSRTAPKGSVSIQKESLAGLPDYNLTERNKVTPNFEEPDMQYTVNYAYQIDYLERPYIKQWTGEVLAIRLYNFACTGKGTYPNFEVSNDDEIIINGVGNAENSYTLSGETSNYDGNNDFFRTISTDSIER